VVDPSEEHLKAEFTGVARTYLPMHAIIRVDEVEKEGHGKITAVVGGEKIMTFPLYTQPDSGKT
ncbi:MAG: DUF1820 family protein, partial [Gammaproteobacteria bacterium]